MHSVLAAAAVAVLAGACAHDVRAHYPGDGAGPTGSITFVFTRPASDVTVAVNGLLVVDDVHSGRVHVDHVPTGYADAVVAAGAGEKALKIWIEDGKDTTVPLGSSGASPVDGWRAAFVSLASVVLYAVLR
jgi:anti-sigma-K factor RskA